MAVTTKTDTKAAAASNSDKPQKLAGATEVAASGAFIEPAIAQGVDTDHVSVDNTPRAGTTAEMNQIDFNNPSALTPPEETVEDELKNG